MVTIQATDRQFVANETQVLQVKRLVSHTVPSLDYSVDPGPGFTITIRDCNQDALPLALSSRLEGIIEGSVEIA